MQIGAAGAVSSRVARVGCVVVAILSAAITVHAGPPPTDEAGAKPTRKLHLAWFIYEDAPEDCRNPGAEVAAYLTAKLKGLSIEIDAKNIQNYAVENVLKADEKFDLFYFTPYTYVLAERLIPRASQEPTPGTVPPLRPLVSYMFHGARERFSTIVWKAKEGATLDALLESLHKDRSKKLALVDPHSSSGYLWPSRLLGRGLEISRGKITTVFAGTHDGALDDLRNWGEVVAAASFDTHLAGYFAKHAGNPEFGQGLRSAALTPPLPLDVIAARDTVNRAEGDAIRNYMLEMGREDNVFRRCFIRKLDRWVNADRSYYDLVRAFMKITEPAPRLRLEPDCSEPRRAWIIGELRDWFSVLDPAAPDEPGVNKLSCTSRGETLDDEALRKKLGELRKANYMTGYIDEESAVDATPSERDLKASFGDRRGLVPGMVAVIKRRVWLADDLTAQGEPVEIRARVTKVFENGEVQLRAVEPAARLPINQDLDPGDRLIMWVEVQGYSSDVEGAEDKAALDIGVKDAGITPKGGMEVEYRVLVRDLYTGKRLPANRWGWLLETSREGELPKLDLIPPGGYDGSDQIALGGNSLSSRVTIRLLGSPLSAASGIGSASDCENSKAACVSHRFGFWSGLRVWIFVLLGGLLGTGLRWAGHATASPERTRGAVQTSTPGVPKLPRDTRWWIRFVARHGVELAAGLGTALLLFLVFVTVRPDMLKALDPNAIITRLGVGAVGGVLGAAGLGALIHRMIGLKS